MSPTCLQRNWLLRVAALFFLTMVFGNVFADVSSSTTSSTWINPDNPIGKEILNHTLGTAGAGSGNTYNGLAWNSSPDASVMINNIAGQVPILMHMVTAIAYVMGMYLIFMGILKLKQYGEARTQMSGQHHLKEPMAFLIIGALLIYLPTSVQLGLQTFWSNPVPYGYTTDQNYFVQLYQSVFLVVELFGTIALVRGLLMLSKAGGGHGQPGQFAKGVTHIIAGLLCINLYGLVQVILETLGFLQ